MMTSLESELKKLGKLTGTSFQNHLEGDFRGGSRRKGKVKGKVHQHFLKLTSYSKASVTGAPSLQFSKHVFSQNTFKLLILENLA